VKKKGRKKAKKWERNRKIGAGEKPRAGDEPYTNQIKHGAKKELVKAGKIAGGGWGYGGRKPHAAKSSVNSYEGPGVKN